MSITTYTTANSIRAVLGISEAEIPDATVVDPIYEVVLKEDLRALSTTLRAEFVALLAVVSPTEIQSRAIEITQTYCAYQVASQMLGSLKMFAPQTIKDSRTEFSRVSDPFEGLREAVSASLNHLRSLLLSAYADVAGTTAKAQTVRRMVGSVGLGLNPITG